MIDDVVVIVGAGAAGISAAISAARRGVDVVLLETNSSIGGTVAHCLIHTIGGIYDSSAEHINEGLPQELASRLFAASPLVRKRQIGRTWTLTVDPSEYQAVVEAWINEEPRINVQIGCTVSRVEFDQQEIQIIEVSTPESKVLVRPLAVMDATGRADIVRTIDPALVADSHIHAAGGLIFQITGVDSDALKFPRSVDIVRAIRKATDQERLPALCAMAWIDTGIAPNEAYGKLAVPLGNNWRDSHVAAETKRNAEKTRDALMNFLVSLPGFQNASLGRTGELGIRDGGLVKGEYCLMEKDVRSARKFSDAAARCSWPIEYWHPETGVELNYLEGTDYYEIPLGALKVERIKNLWVGGKCLSAQPRAQASARIAGCCWAMGDSVGKNMVQ